MMQLKLCIVAVVVAAADVQVFSSALQSPDMDHG